MGRFLVTGGAGLIGSNLCYRLVADGHDVRILDNLASGLLKNLEDVSDRVEFVEADLRDSDAVQSAVDGIEYVFHQAAIPSVQASVDNPLEDQSINAAGTLSLLDASRKASVRRFVFVTFLLCRRILPTGIRPCHYGSVLERWAFCILGRVQGC